VLKDYSKITNFLIVPINALFSYLIFRKSKQNYTENLIINIFLLAGMLVFRFLLYGTLLFSANLELFNAINITFVGLTFIYIIIFYYQYFKAFSFTKAALIRKVLIIAILILITKQGVNMLINQVGLLYLH